MQQDLGRPTLEKDAYLTSTQHDAQALLEVARGRFSLPVPTCPDWTVRQVVAHMGSLYRWFGGMIASRSQERGRFPARPPADDAGETALLDWFADSAEQYLTASQNTDPDERIWTWWPDLQIAGFWFRRAAQESAMHRWDVQNAVGEPRPIDAEIALDGIEEAFDIIAPLTRRRSETEAHGETYHFHRTDGPGEWLVRFEDGDVIVTREHAKGNVAVRGTASDLLLFLWRRIPADRLEIYGDRALLDHYFELAPPP